MLIEEETKEVKGLSPEVLEVVFEEDVLVDEEIVIFKNTEEDEEADEIDIAFAANDEGYW